MPFLSTLARGLASGINQQTQEKINQRNFQQSLANRLLEQRTMLPQKMEEQETMFKHKLDMEKKYLPQIQEIEREKMLFEKQVKDDFSKLPPVADPEYLAAMQNNDFSAMYQIASQKPDLMPHLQQYYTMIGKHKQAYDQHLQKIEETEKIKTEYARQRAGFRKSGGGKSNSGGSVGATPDPVSGVRDSKDRRKKVTRSMAKTEQVIDDLTYALQTETDPAKRAEYSEMLDQYNLKMQEFRNDLNLLDGAQEKFDVPRPGKQSAAVRPEVKKALANVKSDKDLEKINAMQLTKEEADWANSELEQKHLQSMLDNFEKRSKEYLDLAFPKRNVVKRTEAK
jgi:hypothetical protein